MKLWRSISFATLSTLYFDIASASAGDYSPAYNRCVESCSLSCPTSAPLPWSLRLLRWTCEEDCSYQCAQRLTKVNLEKPRNEAPPGGFKAWWDEADWTEGSETEGFPPGKVVQFHGKWPFKRILGFQEPASVIFSILNLLSYASSYNTLNQATRVGQGRLRREYMGVVYAGFNAWIWSAVFHSRDRRWTERADYYAAGWCTLWGLNVAIVRTFMLYRPTRRPLKTLSFLGTLIVFGLHLWWLNRGERFDYDYNMAFNVTASLLVMILWLRWTILLHFVESSGPPGKGRPPHYAGTLIPSVWLLSAGALELLDFPPIWGIDAHALWHLATVPLARRWCVGFLAKDARWVEEEEARLDRYE